MIVPVIEKPMPQDSFPPIEPPSPPETTRTFVRDDATRSFSDAVSADDARTVAGPSMQNRAIPAGINIPNYEIQEELGRGGMGIVFRARDTRLNRLVALKVIKDIDTSDTQQLARFLAEAEAVAAVDHPNVVRVYEFGQHEGRPYLAMEYLSGGSLAGSLKNDSRLDPSAAAALVEKIARGVQAAHDQGIVHRDLKPGNILLTGGAAGGDSSGSGHSRPAPAPGEPKITDFGLAKRGDLALTRTDAVMGTPAYMSPEQASGRTKFAGPAADIYAVGVILYECLTGTIPFRGDDNWDVIRRVINDEPEVLSSRRPGIPRDLDLVCRKCLAKDPAERYPTASALAGDLSRFLSGEPVTVRPAGKLERAVKWARRNPTRAAAYGGTLAAVVLAGLAAVMLGLWQTAKRERAAAEQARLDVEREREKLARFEYGRTIQVAYQNWQEKNLAGTQALLESTDMRYRGWEWRYLHRLCNGHSFLVRNIQSAELSRDGQLLLTVHDQAIKLWDLATGTERLSLERGTQLMSASLSHDGRKILTAERAKQTGASQFMVDVRIWCVADGRQLVLIQDPTIHDARFNLEGTHVLTRRNETAMVWNAETGARIAEWNELSTSWSNTPEISPDGSRIISSWKDKSARLWKTEGGEPRILAGHSNEMKSAFSRDGKMLLTTDLQTAHMRDGSTGEILSTLKPPSGTIFSASTLSANGTRAVTALYDHSVRTWDARKGVELKALKGHTEAAHALAITGDGSRIASGANDSTARVWDAEAGEEIHILRHPTPVKHVAISQDGQRVLTVADDRAARVWQLKAMANLQYGEGEDNLSRATDVTWSGRRYRIEPTAMGRGFSWSMLDAPVLPPDDQKPEKVVLSADEKRVAIAFKNNTVLLWDRVAGRELSSVAVELGPFSFLALNPDGTRLLVQSNSRSLPRILEVSSGAELLQLRGPNGVGISEAVFSADGSRIITGFNDSSVRMWDAATGDLKIEFKGHTRSIRRIAFDSTGARMATGSDDRTLRVWNIETGAELAVFKGHTDQIVSLAFSPDGQRLVSGSLDKTARVWDPASGAEVFTIKDPKANSIDGVAASFSADGLQLRTSIDGRSFRVWESSPVELQIR